MARAAAFSPTQHGKTRQTFITPQCPITPAVVELKWSGAFRSCAQTRLEMEDLDVRKHCVKPRIPVTYLMAVTKVYATLTHIDTHTGPAPQEDRTFASAPHHVHAPSPSIPNPSSYSRLRFRCRSPNLRCALTRGTEIFARWQAWIFGVTRWHFGVL